MNDNDFTPDPVVIPTEKNSTAPEIPGTIRVEAIPENDYHNAEQEFDFHNYEQKNNNINAEQENADIIQENINTNQQNNNIPQENQQAPQNPQADEENQEEEGMWVCPICMEELHEPVLTPCGHVFCKRCIEEWLYRSSSCPSCNAKNIKKENLIIIKGQGEAEDRPEFDNSIKFNRWYTKLFRFLRKYWLSLIIILANITIVIEPP